MRWGAQRVARALDAAVRRRRARLGHPRARRDQPAPDPNRRARRRSPARGQRRSRPPRRARLRRRCRARAHDRQRLRLVDLPAAGSRSRAGSQRHRRGRRARRLCRTARARKRSARACSKPAKALRRTRPRLALALVGDGPMREELAALAADSVERRAPGRSAATRTGRADGWPLPIWSRCPAIPKAIPTCSSKPWRADGPWFRRRSAASPKLSTTSCSILVPPRDAAALAGGWRSVLDRSWDETALSRNASRAAGRMSPRIHLRVCARMRSPQRRDSPKTQSRSSRRRVRNCRIQRVRRAGRRGAPAARDA